MNRLIEHLEKIPYFHQVVLSGSIRKASQALGISQPSLTKSMKILEESLEVTLFERGRHGIKLSEYGQTLFRYSTTLIETSNQTYEQLKPGGNTVYSLGTHDVLLPQLLSKIKHKVSISTHPSVRELLHKLKHLELDFIITPETFDIKHSPLTVSKKLFNDTYHLYCHPEFKVKSLANKKLSELPLIYADSISKNSNSLNQSLKEKDPQVKSLYNVQTLESVINLTISKLGIGILPHAVAKMYTQNNVLKKLKYDLRFLGENPIVLTWRKSSSFSKELLSNIY